MPFGLSAGVLIGLSARVFLDPLRGVILLLFRKVETGVEMSSLEAADRGVPLVSGRGPLRDNGVV